MVDYVRGQSSSGSEARKIEALHNQIVDKAREEFERKHLIPLLVHCIWGVHEPLSRTEIKRLAVDISSFVENHVPQRVYESVAIKYDDLEASAIEQFIPYTSIIRLKPSARTLWSNTEAGFIELQTDELQALISFKDTKIDAYLKRCAYVWLIIVADGRHISSNAELKAEVLQHRFKSRFERVLFYNSVNERVSPLINKA